MLEKFKKKKDGKPDKFWNIFTLIMVLVLAIWILYDFIKIIFE